MPGPALVMVLSRPVKRVVWIVFRSCHFESLSLRIGFRYESSPFGFFGSLWLDFGHDCESISNRIIIDSVHIGSDHI